MGGAVGEPSSVLKSVTHKACDSVVTDHQSMFHADRSNGGDFRSNLCTLLFHLLREDFFSRTVVINLNHKAQLPELTQSSVGIFLIVIYSLF